MEKKKETAASANPEAWPVVDGDVRLHLTEEDVLDALRTAVEEDGVKPVWVSYDNGAEVIQSSVNAVELEGFIEMLREDMTFRGQVFEGEGILPELVADEHYCDTMPTFSWTAVVDYLIEEKTEIYIYQIQIDPWRPMPF